jgi:hypothetical protein
MCVDGMNSIEEAEHRFIGGVVANTIPRHIVYNTTILWQPVSFGCAGDLVLDNIESRGGHRKPREAHMVELC